MKTQINIASGTDLDNVRFNSKGAYIETNQRIELFLQRQGVSKTLNCGHPLFFVEIVHGYEGNYSAQIYGKDQQTHKAEHNLGKSEQPAIDFIERYTSELTGKTVVIMDQRLSYMFGWVNYDYQANDLILSPVHYCEYSDTIRVTKENYCLVNFTDGDFDQPRFDMDGATVDIRKYAIKALNNGFHDCDRKKGQDHCKRRLAWLIGAYMADDLTGARFNNLNMTKAA